jgi:dolichol kinase
MVIEKRKAYRIVFGGIAPTVCLLTSSKYFSLVIASLFLTLLLALEYERFKNPSVWQWLLSHFGNFFKTVPGVLTGDTFFMTATFLSLLYFPFPIAVASLYFLVFGDAASGVVGTRWGKIPLLPHKSLEGLFAEILLNMFVAFLLYLRFHLSFYILGAGVLVGSIMEVISIKVDDNITVGLVPGIIMSILYLRIL